MAGSVKCAKCDLNPKDDPSLTFHRFPLPSKHGPLKAQVWAKFCYPDGDWSSNESLQMLYAQHKMLCGKHFDDSSFTSTDRKRLNKFAIPTEAQSILAQVRDEQRNSPSETQETKHPKKNVGLKIEKVPGTSQYSISIEDSNIQDYTPPESPVVVKEIKKKVILKPKQTPILRENFIKSMGRALDDKLNPLREENNKLKHEVLLLKEKVHKLEKDARKNNIILHEVEEQEQHSSLMEVVLKTLNDMAQAANIDEFVKWEICDTYRLGRKDSKKKRPILLKLSLLWRKLAILQNNKHFTENVYATEDFPEEVLQDRTELKVKRQRKKTCPPSATTKKNKQGKGQDKRKRSPRKTPESTRTNSERDNLTAPNKINKTNKFEFASCSRTLTVVNANSKKLKLLLENLENTTKDQNKNDSDNKITYQTDPLGCLIKALQLDTTSTDGKPLK